jgi:uncharacterized protein (TIGR00251 family)
VVRVTAPPVDGKANRALCKLVAKRLGIAASRVTLASGDRSRTKVLEISGVDADAAAAALAAGKG